MFITRWLSYSTDSCDLDLSLVFHDKYQWKYERTEQGNLLVHCHHQHAHYQEQRPHRLCALLLRPLDLLQRHVAEAHGKLASRLNNRKLDIIVLLLKHKKLTWWYSIVCLLLTISPELKKDTIVILSNLSRTSSIKQTKLPDTFLTMMIQFLFL